MQNADEVTESLVIGRNTVRQPNACDISVEDDYVSNRHARVTCTNDGEMTVEDLGSMNGTWLNGVRIYGKRPLRVGDRLRVGRTEVEVPPLRVVHAER